MHDSGFLFLLAFAANPEDGKGQSAAKRISSDCRFHVYDLVASFEGEQCNFYVFAAARRSNSVVAWPAIRKQEVNRRVCAADRGYACRGATRIRYFSTFRGSYWPRRHDNWKRRALA